MSYLLIYPLPSLPIFIAIGNFAGWVIPGRVLAGEYPGGWEDADHIQQLEGLLTHGVDCVVNLQVS